MKRKKFRNISEILDEIIPRSEEIKEFLYYKYHHTEEKSSKKLKIIEHTSGSVIISNESENSEMHVFDDPHTSKDSIDTDSDINIILDKLNEIKNEIKIIKDNDKISKESENAKNIKILKNEAKKEKIEILKNKNELIKIDEYNESLKENSSQNLNENHDKIDGISNTPERAEEKYEGMFDNSQEDTSINSKDKNADTDRHVDKTDELGHNKNGKQNNLQRNQNKNETATNYLDKTVVNPSSNNFTNTNFIKKIIDKKLGVRNIKNFLRTNSLKTPESIGQKINELNSRIQELQSKIDFIRLSGKTPPANLVAELQYTVSLKTSIESATNITSSDVDRRQ